MMLIKNTENIICESPKLQDLVDLGESQALIIYLTSKTYKTLDANTKSLFLLLSETDDGYILEKEMFLRK